MRATESQLGRLLTTVSHGHGLFEPSQDDVVPGRVGRDHLVADADRQRVFAVELLGRDLEGLSSRTAELHSSA